MQGVVNGILRDLQTRYECSSDLLVTLEKALAIYDTPEYEGVKIPPCSKEHLEFLVRDLKKFVEEVHRVRCNLPRVLSLE